LADQFGLSLQSPFLLRLDWDLQRVVVKARFKLQLAILIPANIGVKQARRKNLLVLQDYELVVPHLHLQVEDEAQVVGNQVA